MAIKIVTDSTCDLPPEVIQELDIRVVPLYINIGDQGYLDGVDITRKDFYTNLPDYETHPTTAVPSTETFKSVYHELAQTGADELLSIHISESLSATVDVARAAAREFNEIPVSVLDSRQLSMGTGFQVELAARMARAGESMKSILTALDDLMKRTFVAAGLDTLEFLRRSGRMNVFLAGIGSFLQLKPILTMREGKPGSEKVRTTRKEIERLVSLLRENLPIERFALLHANAADKAREFGDSVKEFLPKGNIPTLDITPVIGAHIGPGAFGFALVGGKASA